MGKQKENIISHEWYYYKNKATHKASFSSPNFA
jgi:hypothetical protein